ncbi:MAG: hypothetical protein WCJ29_03245 [bacterium]
MTEDRDTLEGLSFPGDLLDVPVPFRVKYRSRFERFRDWVRRLVAVLQNFFLGDREAEMLQKSPEYMLNAAVLDDEYRRVCDDIMKEMEGGIRTTSMKFRAAFNEHRKRRDLLVIAILRREQEKVVERKAVAPVIAREPKPVPEKPVAKASDATDPGLPDPMKAERDGRRLPRPAPEVPPAVPDPVVARWTGVPKPEKAEPVVAPSPAAKPPEAAASKPPIPASPPKPRPHTGPAIAIPTDQVHPEPTNPFSRVDIVPPPDVMKASAGKRPKRRPHFLDETAKPAAETTMRIKRPKMLLSDRVVIMTRKLQMYLGSAVQRVRSQSQVLILMTCVIGFFFMLSSAIQFFQRRADVRRTEVAELQKQVPEQEARIEALELKVQGGNVRTEARIAAPDAGQRKRAIQPIPRPRPAPTPAPSPEPAPRKLKKSLPEVADPSENETCGEVNGKRVCFKEE